MTRRAAKAAITAGPSAKPAALIDAGLDALDIGFAIFDQNLKLVDEQQGISQLARLPGHAVPARHRYHRVLSLQCRARRLRSRRRRSAGDIAHGARPRTRRPHELEYELASGRILNIRYAPIPDGGLVLSYSDITARKRAERTSAQGSPAPGRARQHARAPSPIPTSISTSSSATTASQRCIRYRENCSNPGRPYPDFLRYLAEHGYYGEGDVEALVARRVESLRNPTGNAFEDHTPDGRV